MDPIGRDSAYCLQKDYQFTVLIILDKGLSQDLLLKTWNQADYVICLGESPNTVYKKIGPNYIPNCMIGNFSRINYMELYKNGKTKLIPNYNSDRVDIEKALWMSLELFAEQEEVTCYETEAKRFCILILGYPSWKIDETLATYSVITRYVNHCFVKEFEKIDMFLITKSAVSRFLKRGTNIIYPISQYFGKEISQYSIVALKEEAYIKVYENSTLEEKYTMVGSKKMLDVYIDIGQVVKFGYSSFFSNKRKALTIKIEVESQKECSLLYSSIYKYLK